jgi:dihydroflavonol-4-reductase
MRALVTGATGFIGGAVARALRGRGWEVTALVRSPDRARALADAGIVLAHGDITDQGSLAAAIPEHDAVFHLAAWYAIGVRDRRLMTAINVGGTTNVLRAAENAGVRRVVHCSSVTALGGCAPDEVGNETKVHDGRFASVYEETKHAGHLAARAAAARGRDVVTVMPAAVYGPGDESILGLLIRLYARKLLVVLPAPNIGVSWVHVDDVAAGMIAAHDRAEPGGEYILGGDNLRIMEMLRRCEPHTGVRAPRAVVPAWMLRATLPLSPLYARVIGQPPGLAREGLATMSGSQMYSSARAREGLGYRWRPVEEGITQTVAAIRRPA